MGMNEGRRPGQPEVVLMCGIAGSGKTTYAKDLETKGFVRLSIDEEIWHRFGRYGIDYGPDEYEQHTEVAREAMRERLLSLLAEGRDVVVDSSFWQRSRRQEYKQLIEQAGGRWRLVYLQVDPALLRARLYERAERFDANAAFPITDGLLARYLDSFEPPYGEGEEAIVVSHR
ncbi:AAA family ATPase [Phytohabitans rumicis]|nr:ATP-binding protein [Phytohabitans rumicis]